MCLTKKNISITVYKVESQEIRKYSKMSKTLHKVFERCYIFFILNQQNGSKVTLLKVKLLKLLIKICCCNKKIIK